MNYDLDAGMLAAHALDLLRREALVHGTVALPEDNAALRIASGVLPPNSGRDPKRSFVRGNAHAVAGIAAEMFIGRKRTFSPTSKAHFMTSAALELVQTEPPFSPVKA